MFPDYLINRILLRIGITTLHLVAPVAIAWTVLAFALSPAPPPIILFGDLPLESVDKLYEYDRLFLYLNVFFAVEAAWWVIHRIGRTLVARGIWELRSPKEVLSQEERWRLWVKMLESSEDVGNWLDGIFLQPGHKSAPRGIEDPAVTKVKLQDVGRGNVERFLAHFLWNCNMSEIKKGSLDAAEIHAMIVLLETALRRTRPGFTFKRGNTGHHVFLVNDEPIHTRHHPMIFYCAIWITSELGNFALWAAGFRYYGPKRSWPFPLFFMRGSRTALENIQDPEESKKMGDTLLSDTMGYWYHPPSAAALEQSLEPVVFAHGISGTYGPSPFLIYLQWRTGRPMFMPELPYVAMRLSPPSAIRTRVEMVAAVRRAIWRHGHGVTWPPNDDEDEEEWRRGRAILVGHSLGAGPVSWILRDAPDIVAGTVLIDPMSILLFSAATPRNFFRTKSRTAGEIFFRYFASERAIHHFLARHLRWSDSVIFGPKPVSPLPEEVKTAIVPKNARQPLDVPFDRPNYAQFISPMPSGPFPSVVLLSENDCILPAKKMATYLRATGFVDGESLWVMPRLEHAAILVSPYWGDKVAEAIINVAKASEKWWTEVETESEAGSAKALENGHEHEQKGQEVKIPNGRPQQQ